MTTETKTFKSERAAKMAMTKAENAYVEAMRAANCAYQDAMGMEGVDPLEFMRQKETERVAAYAVGEAIYNQARAQGFWVKSWYFGSNVTRDLIAANMD